MTITQIRRRVAVVGVTATIVITGTGAAGAGPSSASDARDGTPDRPCFMVRANWNTAEGPQPTCPVPTWQRGSTARAGSVR